MAPFWVALAGFIASALTAAFFAVARSLELSRYSPTLQYGCLIVADHRLPLAETAGLVLHLLIGSTILPAVYWVVLPWLGGPGWISGAVLGMMSGGAVIAALPWTAGMNRCVRAGRLPAPGRFGTGWGRYTAAVILIGSVAYGLVVGGVLGAT